MSSVNSQELDLSGNQIKRAGAVAIGRAVASLPAFERLLLDENEISADGIAQLKVRVDSVLNGRGAEMDVVSSVFTGVKSQQMCVQAILMAAGKGEVLGPMDENDEDAEDDDDDFEDAAGADDQADGGLSEALAKQAAIH